MWPWLACLSLCGLLSLTSTVYSSTLAPTSTAEFEQGLIEFRKANRIQSFSVAVSSRDRIVFSGSYGFQDHDAEESTTAETTYLAASITKTFSAATLLAMEADGYIDLQDDFTKLSDWDGRCEWLGRSGIIFGGGTLADGTIIEAVPCDTQFSLEQVLSHRVNGQPGNAFFYNPVVFGRLANWVEEQTGKPWRYWMRRYVIEPAELKVAAGWRDANQASALTHLAPPFRHVDLEVDSDGITASPLPNPELNASSGIIASAEELARYGSALLEGRILSRPLLDRMWGMDGGPYSDSPHGLGWYREEINGLQVFWHGGWWPDAYAGMLMVVPERSLVFVALGNTDGIHKDNPLNGANAKAHPLVQQFFDAFVAKSE